MKSKLLLVGESFSPWTKKARWALEHCGLDYDYQEYTPTLSEPGLRWKMKKLLGSVSVPVLFADRKILRGSWEIACYANDTVGGKRLGDMQIIEPWNDLSEAALAEGRTRIVRSILNNNQALEEGLPAFVPSFLRRPMRFMAKDAVRRLDRKYAHLVKPGSLDIALQEIRNGLSESPNEFLLDSFSYADITMAVVMEVIAPIAHVEPPLGPVTQEIWNDSVLAEENQDLVAWRDSLASNVETTYSQFR